VRDDVSVLEIRDDLRVRRIVSPEGIPLPFRIAPAGDRILAFTLDVVIIYSTVMVLLLVGLIAGLRAGGIPLSFAILAGFLLRNFYFTWMELRYGGRTVGKMKLGLRVIARDGGPLTPEAVIARNLTRDLEVFLPLTALISPSLILPSAPAWGALLAISWLVVLMVLPLCNKDRLRCGDIIAGTIVVKAPAPILLSDLTAGEARAIRGERAAVGVEPEYSFSVGQLDHYGIRELQILEGVLRDGDANQELLRRVSERIRKKIGWPAPAVHEDDYRFLMAFYKAQRSRLEQRLLLGERRERKRE
jgi:uncharacterized RDD family membrane protein YckC